MRKVTFRRINNEIDPREMGSARLEFETSDSSGSCTHFYYPSKDPLQAYHAIEMLNKSFNLDIEFEMITDATTGT